MTKPLLLKTLLAVILMAASLTAVAAGNTPHDNPRQQWAATSRFDRITAQQPRHLQQCMKRDGWSTPAALPPAALPATPQRAPEAAAEMQDFDDFGWLQTPGGSYWYYTMQLHTETLSTAGFEDKTITGFEATVYDERCQPVGRVAADLPLLEGETRIVAVDLAAQLTKSFFNSDSNYELMVMVNANTARYINNVRTYVYSITPQEGKSEALWQTDGMMVHAQNASEGSYESFYLIFDQDGYANTDGSFTPASADAAEDAVRGQRFTILKKAGYSKNPVEIGHFDLPDSESSYNDGLPILVKAHGDSLYLAVTGYEKPYFANPDDYEDWTVTPDNHFFLRTYSMPLTGYSQTLKQGSTTRIPVELSTDSDVPFVLYGTGMLDYMNDFRFDGEGRPSFIVVSEAYQLSTDSHADTFREYAADGSLQATVFENAESVLDLSDVNGCPVQKCFITSNIYGEYLFHFVNMDNFATALELPATYLDNSLTTTLDRVDLGLGRYQYVVNLAQAEENEAGRLCEVMHWINADGTLDRKVLLDLGDNVAIAYPNVTAPVLNPYFINTDDACEYMFIVYRYTGESSKSRAELLVLNEQGQQVLNIKPEADSSESLSRVWTGNQLTDPVIVMVYTTPDDQQRAEVYNLPLTRFEAGGTGTPDDPYLISTAGDLQQVTREPAASYRVDCPIDAARLTLNAGSTVFTGSFDGNNQTISNLRIAGEHCSLLGTLTGTEPAGEGAEVEPMVRNLVLVNPVIEPQGYASAGLLASSASQHVYIDQVHVYGLKAQADNKQFTGAFGSLVGDMSVYSHLTRCSVNEAQINLPDASPAGGLVSSLRTSSSVKGSLFSGSLTALEKVGGISGECYESSNSTECGVQQCHVQADLTASHTLGGVVGADNHTNISNNYVEGSLTATGGDSWNGACVGGVIGSLSWKQGEGKSVKGNVVNLETISYDPNLERPNWASAVSFETAHRIVGMTDYNDTETEPDGWLSDNYAVSPLQPLFEAEVYAGHEGAEGATLAASELTQAFCQRIGFAYGQTADAPWLDGSETLRLYFEDQTTGISEAPQATPGQSLTLSGQRISCPQGTIRLYNAAGQLVATGRESLSTSQLPAGVYVAACAGHTLKVVVRSRR